MTRKRRPPIVDLSTDESSDPDYDDVQCSQLPSVDSEMYSQFSEEYNSDSSSDDKEGFNHALFDLVMRDFKLPKKLKRQFSMTTKHMSKKPKLTKKSDDGFTRFSATNFSSVVDALSPEHKAVIERYGFGSLLQFKKCFVPKKFATWVARLVDPKSGDIIIHGRVISLTKESVNLVLGLPLGEKPFPSDPSVGKAIVLSKFNKDNLPQVTYFANKLIKKDNMSDEDAFVCFMVVALTSFLCSNSSLTPSPKYFDVFEDIRNAKDYDWCGFVLQWLLDAIKAFTKGKHNNSKPRQSLGGCIFYLAVIYLDHVDFGQRQVAEGFPRISLWEKDMIKFYSELDMKSPGIYGHRPVMDCESTCYAKFARYKPIGSLDVQFCEKMEQVSGCRLPHSLKVNILNLIERHCCSCAVSINMDVLSLANVSNDLKKMFIKLMNNACNMESRTKDLVIALMKAITEADPCDSQSPSPPVVETRHNSTSFSTEHYDVSPRVNSPQSNIQDNPGFIQQVSNATNTNNSSKLCGTAPPPPVRSEGQRNFASAPDHSSVREADDLQKILVNIVHIHTPPADKGLSQKKFQFPPSGSPHRGPTTMTERVNIKPNVDKSHIPQKSKGSIPNPLVDISNTHRQRSVPKDPLSANCSRSRDNDVILFQNDYVPDSVSPSPSQRCRRPFQSSKGPFDSENSSHAQSEEDHIIIQTLPFSQEDYRHITPKLAKKSSIFSSTRKERSPEVQITGSRTLADNIKDMVHKSEIIYNSNLENLGSSGQTPHGSAVKIHAYPSISSLDPSAAEKLSEFRVRNSSSGGKVPLHGPRRVVIPSRFLDEEFDTQSKKYHVTKSEISNYKAICTLGSSTSSGEDAIYFAGVRCTYWSLGESLKPGGFVNNFVIAVFCYHLFCKPHGYPDDSKRHYFFSNIADQLLKDPGEASEDVMMKAFKRSSKTRPLTHSDLLFFPTLYDNHWFLFIVDIKDNKFVFLDSYYRKDDSYQVSMRDQMIPSFQFWWDKYIGVDKGFEEYEVLYPRVPRQSDDNETDSGVYVMMFLEHWNSPRTVYQLCFKKKTSQTSGSSLQMIFCFLIGILERRNWSSHLTARHMAMNRSQAVLPDIHLFMLLQSSSSAKEGFFNRWFNSCCWLLTEHVIGLVF